MTKTGTYSVSITHQNKNKKHVKLEKRKIKVPVNLDLMGGEGRKDAFKQYMIFRSSAMVTKIYQFHLYQ